MCVKRTTGSLAKLLSRKCFNQYENCAYLIISIFSDILVHTGAKSLFLQFFF